MNVTLQSFDKIFFCTGARNHELLKDFAPDKLVFEYDERMASFKALGLARMSRTPVAICCTSGTAVAECIPALLEAYYSQIPLVLISGDRPAKMHGTGAPQTIHHAHLTEKVVGTYVELSLEEFKNFELKNVKFPLHLNVLVDDSRSHEKEIKTNCTLTDFEAFIGQYKSPLFLFSHEDQSMRDFVMEFKKTNIPFYAESMSGARDLSVFDSEKTLVKLLKDNFFDAVVRVGYTPLSKVWRLLEMNHLPVFSFDARNLAALSHGAVASLGSLELLKNEKWWNSLKHLSGMMTPETKSLDSFLGRYQQAEMSVVRLLQKRLPENALVYLGNSLVIRFFELVQKKNFRIHGSRGVNGIDGQLATAIGIAMGTKETVYCLLGDVTTLYDLSSLREMPSNLKLIIMNNSGGRIFDMLGLDKRIVMEHDKDFENICRGFNLRYGRDDLNLLNSVQVLELFPDREQTSLFLKDWNA